MASPRTKRKRIESSASEPPSRDVESEEEEEEEEEEDDDEDDDSRSASAIGDPSRMTARQAVLEGVAGATHVALGTSTIPLPSWTSLIRFPTGSTTRKKKELNEAELALRREETARKRKHMTEKKLEDEKVK